MKVRSRRPTAPRRRIALGRIKLRSGAVGSGARGMYMVLHQAWVSDPWSILQVILVSALTGLAPALQVWLMGRLGKSLVHAAVTPGAGRTHGILVYLAAIVATSLVTQLLSVFQGRALLRAQSRLSAHLSSKIIRRAIGLSLPQVEDATVQDSVQRASREVNYRPGMLLQQTVLLVTQIVTLFSVGTVLATMDWRVALLAVLAPLPSVASQIIQGRRGHELEYSRSQDRRRLSYWQQLVSHPKSLKEILTFQLAPLVTERHDTLLNGVVRADLKLANRILRVQTPLMLVSALIGFAAQAVAVLVNTSTAGIATLLAVIQGIATIQASTQQLMSAVGSAYVNQLYLRNVIDFLALPSDVAADGAVEFPRRIAAGIEFRDVSFRYPGSDQDALTDISLTLRPGETTAVVGFNGAGKSTLTKLIARLYEPSAGRILVDGTPLPDYRVDSLRSRISFVFQDFCEYELSVGENIGVGALHDPAHFTTLPAEGAKRVGMAEHIEALPEGYDSQAGRLFEGGVQFSGGQWQRLAIARGLVREAGIRLMDEPTSALDAVAEAELLDALTDVRPDQINLIVAHRFSTILRADRILVLDGGRVVEDGSHAELLAKNGLYARLFRAQSTVPRTRRAVDEEPTSVDEEVVEVVDPVEVRA
jgi:ATP-binding cassette subfamily B protein